MSDTQENLKNEAEWMRFVNWPDWTVAIEIFHCVRSFPLSQMVIVENRVTKHSKNMK